MNLKTKIFYFWGAMDVLAIAMYVIASVSNGRVPFISDFIAFTGMDNNVTGDGGYSVAVTLFFVLDLIMLLSLFVSAALFFKKHRYAVRFALCQEVLRFIASRYSLALFPALTGLFGAGNSWIYLSLFILSELLKIGSLIYVIKADRHAAPHSVIR